MGLLDNIISAAQNLSRERSQSAADQTNTQQERSVLDGIVDMFKSSGPQDIINSFKDRGLGNILNSWIGAGSNSPISVDQLKNALGPERIRQIASQAGISEDRVGNLLRDLLPNVVDRATPQGTIDPDDGEKQ